MKRINAKRELKSVFEGRLFHGFTTRSQKKLARVPVLRVFNTLNACPLVRELVLSTKIHLHSSMLISLPVNLNILTMWFVCYFVQFRVVFAVVFCTDISYNIVRVIFGFVTTTR